MQTYEIINPKDIGLDNNEIVLTARSGRAALRYRLEVNGVDIKDEETLDKIYKQFLVLADKKKRSPTTTCSCLPVLTAPPTTA